MSFKLNITGGAYLPVRLLDNTVVYTRICKFHIDNTGHFNSEEGYSLFEPMNTIIIPPPCNEPFDINLQGEVTAYVSGSWVILGKIVIYIFTYPDQLQDLGNGYFGQTPGALPMYSGNAGDTGIFADVKIYLIRPGAKKQRPIAALDEPKAIGDFVIKARKIVQDMTNNEGGYFINITPPLATVSSDISELETAEDTAKTHIVGSAAARDLKFDTVLRDLHALQMYVQTLADNASDVLTAEAIINSSGFDLKIHGIHTKDALKATHGEVSGTVNLTAKAIAHAGAYEWQMSNNAANWTSLPAKIEAETIAEDLTPGSTVYFRCRPVFKDGVGDWTQTVSIIVT